MKRSSLPKVLIYEAGESGRQLAAALLNSHEMRVVGFLDDDDRLHGQVLNGLQIYPPDDLIALVESLSINIVLLAIPSANRTRRNAILQRVVQAKVAVRTLPGLMELAQGRVSVTHLHDLDIDDLFGREPVQPNQQLLRKNIVDQVVMVAGTGGSIGSELCRQIIQLHPQQLLLVDNCEHALYAIHAELEKVVEDTNVLPLLASVCYKPKMMDIMSTWQPQTIYHAAAYKNVPLVEQNVVAGVSNMF